MGARAWKFLAAFLGCTTLAGGLAASYFYNRALDYYRREQLIRLDPSSAADFAHRPVPRKVTGLKRVVFVGDSRIERFTALPALAGAESINRGKDGDTSAQVGLRLERDVIALEPDIVVLQLGINDLKTIGAFPDRERFVIDRLIGEVQSITRRLQRAGSISVWTPILPVGPIPLARTPIWSDRTLAAIDEVNRAINQLSGSDVFIVSIDELKKHGRMRTEFAQDEFHLTGAGYAALRTIFETQLPPILRDTK